MIELGVGMGEEWMGEWKALLFKGKQQIFQHSQECWSKRARDVSAR
jgi:hypothetical protein